MKRAILTILLGCIVFYAGVAAFAQEEVKPEEKLNVLSGTISSVNADEKTLAVTDADGKAHKLVVDEEVTIIWMGDAEITLKDVPANSPAEVEYYTDETGNLVADWVDIITEEKEGEAPAPAEGEAAETVPQVELPVEE